MQHESGRRGADGGGRRAGSPGSGPDGSGGRPSRGFFDAVAALVARHRFATILAWTLLAGVLLSLAPPFEEVATQDQTAFLGSEARSMEASEAVERLWPRDEVSMSAALVFGRETGLTRGDRRYVRELERWLNGPSGPEQVRFTQSPSSRPELRDLLVAPDGRAVLMVVAFSTPPFEPATNGAIGAIREHVEGTRPAGLAVHVTGNAGVAADQNEAIRASVERTTIITLVLVVLILLWVYRSPVALLVPLLTIGVAFAVAHSLIAILAGAGLQVSSLVETFMVVIVFGAGTDYCLFVISRYREDLREGAGGRRTLVGTLAIMGAVITSSAATVMVAFGSQAVARFGLYRTIGPAMAIAVGITLLAALTLMPALIALLGRWTFWPSRATAGGATPPALAPLGTDARVAGRRA